MFSSQNSTPLQPQSSLNLAIRDAASAAESRQVEEEDEEGGGVLGIQQIDEEDVEDEEDDEEEEIEADVEEKVGSSSDLNENGRRRRGREESRRPLNGSEGSQMLGGIGGLSTKLSQLGSVAVEDFSEEDEMASTSDSEAFEAGELELIEAALRSLRSVEGDLLSVEGEIEGSSASSDLQDMQDVARLLKKVQAIKARKSEPPLEHTTPSQGGSFMQAPSGGEDIQSADIRQVVKAAAHTALAAAKTAETVVSSLDRNSQAMEALCKALTGFSSPQSLTQETSREDEQEEEEPPSLIAIELRQTEIAKSLVKQNRITHWVLGFIVVSSLVWRYGVVKFVKKVNNTISNPFQGITDMFKWPKEQIEKDDNVKFPNIFDGEDERSRPAAEEKKATAFNFGGILPGSSGEPEAEQLQSDKKKQKAAKEKKGQMFDIRAILPGLHGEKEAEKHEQKTAEQLQSDKKKQKAAEEKKGQMFDIRAILPGLHGEKEAEKHEQKAAEEKDGRPPNFGSIFSGLTGEDQAKQHRGF